MKMMRKRFLGKRSQKLKFPIKRPREPAPKGKLMAPTKRQPAPKKRPREPVPKEKQLAPTKRLREPAPKEKQPAPTKNPHLQTQTSNPKTKQMKMTPLPPSPPLNK